MDGDSLDPHLRAFLPATEDVEMVPLDLISPNRRLAEKDHVSRIFGE